MKDFTILQHPSTEELAIALQRPPAVFSAEIDQVVHSVFEQVKAKPQSLFDYAKEFDKFTGDRFLLTPEEINQGAKQIPQELAQAIDTAYDNIYRFHAEQIPQPYTIETSPGIHCSRKPVPIEKVGLYIPGGSAPLFSTVLMLGIPAQISQCKQVILCTPAKDTRSIHPAILYAAQRCGIHQMYALGGVQAIAAMSVDNPIVPKVHKLFGPGNAYVTRAKQQAQQLGLGIDMPAGPSEVMVLADSSANARFVAADLLSQAEHGTDSQVILLSNHLQTIEQVIQAIQNMVPTLSRADIMEKSLAHARFILVDTAKIIPTINAYAPEHLILCTDNADTLAQEVTNAGSIFIGHYTPESLGDYASGTNHTLPTYGFATHYSGVSTSSFYKFITLQQASKEGLKHIGQVVECMAQHEGLDAHKLAVTERLNTL